MTFVIVVDAQRDFMMPDGALYVAGAEVLVGPIDQWLAALDPAETAGVLLTFDTHEPAAFAASEEAREFPLHCVRGSPGWQSVLDVTAISPAIPLYRLEKDVFAMWAAPDVTIGDMRDPAIPAVPREAFFAGLRARGVEDVTVIGVAADYCVRWAIDGLIARGFRVTVPTALTRGIVRQIETVAAEDWAGGGVTIA
ncbi:MAG: isochorismatase family protein [Sphingomonas sp.]